MVENMNKETSWLILIIIVCLIVIGGITDWKYSEMHEGENVESQAKPSGVEGGFEIIQRIPSGISSGEVEEDKIVQSPLIEWRSYRNEKYGYELDLPEDWQFDETTGDPGSDYEFFGIESIYKWGESQRDYTEIYDGATFNVLRVKNPEDLSFQALVGKMKEEHENYGFTVFEEELDINGWTATALTLEATSRVEYIPYTIYSQNDYVLNKEYYLERKDKIYVINLFAVSYNNIEEFREILSRITSSFRFID